ncbi:5-methylcytosine-specific restriction endonuclease McrA [Arthrobacter pascens]|uniref:HNH endonuclease n=1 Tax=Arthrobacter pascens TaxID=1677 RepID=UPI00285636C6|nr:DUF222 domain-containing protein [Arthrobacter pascens]MDR6558834.1 5-methylcytosine-specific restriction endonuclease McrA [Arthrobacter pascens]
MEGNGNSALTARVPHGDGLHAAAFPDDLFPDTVFPFVAVPDGWFSDEAFPFDEFADDIFLDDGVPYDDEYPESFPEAPFPELLYGDGHFDDVPLDDGAASGSETRRAGTAGPAIADRFAAPPVFLRADLTADGPGLIDQMQAFEKAKCMIAGQQARLAVAFEIRQREEQAEPVALHSPKTLSAEDLGRKRSKEQCMGAGEQIALARGESPHRGGRLLGMSKALVTEMPHTLAALDTGQLNEERALYVVKETACLTVADRTAVDKELAADTGTFAGAGTRAVIATVRAAATRRDPRSVTQRASHAASERSVSLRPAPDCMTYLTALLPAHQGVAVYAALTRHADALHAAADPRSLGQIKADTLVEWTTGTPGGITGIELNVVMTDRTLLQADSEPARLAGYGIVPAAWARNLISDEEAPERQQAPEHPPMQGQEPRAGSSNASHSTRGQHAVRELKVWLRRLYTEPETGDLVGMDSRRRLFPPPLRRFIQIRDDTCRTPYCDAPIRHLDHIIPWHDDGPTSLANGAGLCEACNHTKELPGWKAQPRPGPRHTIESTTPTGHSYRSTAPPLPGSSLPGTGLSELNQPGAGIRETHQSEPSGPSP